MAQADSSASANGQSMPATESSAQSASTDKPLPFQPFSSHQNGSGSGGTETEQDKASSQVLSLPPPTAAPLSPAAFRVRLINIDHVLARPGPYDRTECAFNPQGQPLKRVPVIRVFGATPAGQRVCMHVHGVFPYFYIEYKGSLQPDHVLDYIYRLGRDLNHVIAASLRRNPYESDSAQFVAAIHLCKGVPFYGYSVGWRYYLKISFIDPSHNVRFQTALQSGRIMGTAFQPFEIHIRYQLQFMLDFNLFGCDYVDLDKVAFRRPVPDTDPYQSLNSADFDPQRKVWTLDAVPEGWLQDESIGRVSFCELEIDVVARDILNRRTLRSRDIHQDFDEREDLQGDEKRVPSLTGLWEEERRRRLNRGLDPSIPLPDTAGDKRRYGPGESPSWQATERLEAALGVRLEHDRGVLDSKGLKLDDFAAKSLYDAHIATTFESVEIFHDYQHGPGGSGRRAEGEEGDEQSPARSKLYDLEHSLSQQQQQGAGSGSARDGPSSQSVFGSQATIRSEAGGAQPNDASQSSIDLGFFATQQFLDAVEAVEEQHRVAERPDEESDEEPEPGPDGRASLPQTPRKDRTGAAAQAGFLSPYARSNQGTPTRKESNSFSPAKPSPLKRRLERVVEAGAETAQVPSAQRPRLSGAEEMRRMLQKDWSVRPDIQPGPVTALPNKAKPSPDGKTTKATRGAATQRVMFDLGSSPVAPRSSQVGSSSFSSPVRRGGNGMQPTHTSIGDGAERRYWQYAVPSPTSLEVTGSFEFLGLPSKEYKDPYYSNPSDVPKSAREYAGRSWRFASSSLKYLPEFEDDETRGGEGHRAGLDEEARPGDVKTMRYWEYAMPPPTPWEVRGWDERTTKRKEELRRVSARASQKRMRSATQRVRAAAATTAAGGEDSGERKPAFKLSQRAPTSLVEREKQHMTIFAVEVLACSRGALQPDPARDRIDVIAYSFQHEDESLVDTGSRPGLRTGIIMLRDAESTLPREARLGLSDLAVEVVDDELSLLNALIDTVRTLDPEILVGWEIHHGSWGYIVERAARQFEFDVVGEVSRVNNQNTGRAGGKGDSWGYTQTSAITVTGRHVLNIWRLMRGELTLNQYTRENVVFHLLRRRIPAFSPATLTSWYRSETPALVSRAIRHVVESCETDLELIEASEQVFKTAEFARVYGVDFFSVISRGSQFKVESVMFRIAKPESYLLPSPSRQQVGEQNAAEDLPLIMEPQSAFYKGPLLVLDFQSLYPSVMIAYNICYSTCLGRVSKFKDAWKLGFVEHAPPDGLLALLKDDCFVSPNGLLYAKPHVRRSLLAKMLSEILDTRVMVKGSMKGVKHDKAFRRLQNARQLSLKLLANVTYGYTSASFSGRMPCVEIADSIVQYGRETLERAIAMIHGRPEWGAQVVYGDTDSLFIYLDGRTKDEAFVIGNAIADAVTADNPQPVKLKFEKVYLPSVLLAKKRYVGFMYETPDVVEPEFNAKGIETVRRDGFPAQQRMVEACIRILFRTQDLSLVKEYCQRQWRKILEGRLSAQDFIYAKEVRLGGYSENGVPPPGAAVATRKMFLDKRLEPQHAERVPYIITQGEPKAKQNDRAVGPEMMLANPSLKVDGKHYIERGLIPPLARIFNLLGADVAAWFAEMPRVANASSAQRVGVGAAGPAAAAAAADAEASARAARNRLTLTDHYRTEHCLVCGRTTEADICIHCRTSPTRSAHSALSRLQLHEARSLAVSRVCSSCASLPPGASTPCVSLDCPTLYERSRIERDVEASREVLRRLEIALEDDLAVERATRNVWSGHE